MRNKYINKHFIITFIQMLLLFYAFIIGPFIFFLVVVNLINVSISDIILSSLICFLLALVLEFFRIGRSNNV
jgi:hypothetical protein